MNPFLEEKFVNTYIVKDKRQRLLFELQGKKRAEAIGRFCHGADVLLMASKIKLQGQYIFAEIQNRITLSKSKTCYVISFFEDLDGKEFEKQQVTDTVIGAGMPSIIVFDDFAVVETEQELGPAMKYILE